MAFDPSIIRDTRQKRFHEYWREKAGGRDMPRRADLDPVDFAWMLGWVTLVEPLPDGDWRFVVDGSNVAALFGNDMTGKRVSEYPLPAVRDVLSTTFAAAAAARGPYFLTYDIEHDLRRWRYDGLLLPLCDESGSINRLISTIVLEGGERR
jgi:hypothetical protein